MALLIVMTSATIIGVAYYLAYRNPVDFNPAHAVAILLLALVATAAGEYSREMLRKPYVIGHWMYSNGVRVPYALKIDQQGYLVHSNWVWGENCIFGYLQSPGDTSVPSCTTSFSRGEAIFRGECGSCHTLEGYRPLVKLLSGRDRANIESFITMLHEYKPDSPYHHFMPPMVGTKQDVEDLTDFLNAHVNPPAASGQKPVQTAQK
jgi:mono/diheme cytochrome c family protein